MSVESGVAVAAHVVAVHEAERDVRHYGVAAKRKQRLGLKNVSDRKKGVHLKSSSAVIVRTYSAMGNTGAFRASAEPSAGGLGFEQRGLRWNIQA
jgi:hypothetical protein